MERQRLRTLRVLSSWAARITLGAGILVSGCSTTLDQARVAWADGDGDFDEAEQLYLQALEDPGEGELAREELVEIYLELGKSQSRKKPEEARRYYAKALELDPADADARKGLARAFRDLGLFDDAIAVVSDPQAASCHECHRLEAILLIRRGDELLARKQWAEAEQDYARALEILPDSTVSLGVVRARLGRQDLGAAAAGLKSAVGLIGAHDVTGRQQFLQLRRATVILALEQDDVPLADRLLDVAPTGVGPEAQLALALEVAMALRKKGKPDAALSRMQALVDAAEAGRLVLPEAKKVELRNRVADLYAARAAVHLSMGRVDPAQADLDQALSLRPNDVSLALQQVLVLAGRGATGEAHAALAELEGVKGHGQVSAILAAAEVDGLLAGGKTRAAADKLEEARSLGAALPEVHVAVAQLLSQSPPENLRRGELRDLRRKGLVSYPDGKVTRAGEALSELDWARQQIRGLGPAYAYRGPGTQDRIRALEEKIHRYYPYEVTFQGDPTAILVVHNQGDAPVRISLAGGGFAADATLEPGESERMTVSEPGVLSVRYGGTDALFLTEPYTQVELVL